MASYRGALAHHQCVADAEGFQSGSSTYSPYDNNTGFGPMFAAQGQGENVALTKNGSSVSNAFAGPFYVPAGGSLDVVANGVEAEAGLAAQLRRDRLCPHPRVRAAEARLEQFEQQYANQLRALQLEVSEAYYQLQRDEQLVRIRDAVQAPT